MRLPDKSCYHGCPAYAQRMTRRRPKKLNRFTTLPVLLDLLKRRKLVLLDPSSWEDKNDSGLMLAYKERKEIEGLCALCFSHNDETIHHWRTFADGISGCCIEFDALALQLEFDGIPRVRYGYVKYRKMRELRDATIDEDEIPFTKRWPYRCEEEFRVIWEGPEHRPFFEIPVDLQTINKITINQRMPDQVYETIREYLRQAFKNPDQRISRSTLYENKTWLKKFRET